MLRLRPNPSVQLRARQRSLPGCSVDLIPGREILREPRYIRFTTAKGNNTIRTYEVDCAVFMDSVSLMRVAFRVHNHAIGWYALSHDMCDAIERRGRDLDSLASKDKKLVAIISTP